MALCGWPCARRVPPSRLVLPEPRTAPSPGRTAAVEVAARSDCLRRRARHRPPTRRPQRRGAAAVAQLYLLLLLMMLLLLLLLPPLPPPLQCTTHKTAITTTSSFHTIQNAVSSIKPFEFGTQCCLLIGFLPRVVTSMVSCAALLACPRCAAAFAAFCDES